MSGLQRAAVLPGQQLSRCALLYLLAAFSGCAALLAAFLPLWITFIAIGCLGYRLLVFSGRLSFPSVWQKRWLVLLSTFALVAQYRHGISLDAFVALLLLGFSLKLLEIYHKQDAQWLLFLAFFVLMTFFLYQQALWLSLLAFLHVVILLAALIAIHSGDVLLVQRWSKPLFKAMLVFVSALPVMLFMFVVMPRFPPLWAMPLQKQQAKTGMSAEMSPGDIGKLTRSAELVLRAGFTGKIPEKSSLYWLGLRLDNYDGVRWTASCVDCDKNWLRTDKVPDEQGASLLHYQVILEPHGDKWLFVLDNSRIHDVSVWSDGDGLYRAGQDLQERFVYEVDIKPAVGFFLSHEDRLSSEERRRYLTLPENIGPLAHQRVQQWRQDGFTDEQVIRAVLDDYNANFMYTLEPPELTGDRIDDFLFVTRSGFCEHFASSFVFMMRAANIPSRVVTGYMGGEIHSDTTSSEAGFVTVRQYDAHAWAEIWLPDKGWLRVDPTASVSPERIEQGFEQVFADSPALNAIFSLKAYSGIFLVNRMRLNLERMDYLWARWVLGYEGETQMQLLRQWGFLSPWRLAAWVGGFLLLVFGGFFVFLYWRMRSRVLEHPLTRIFRRVCEDYARLGCVRFLSETPLQYAQRVQAADLPRTVDFSCLCADYYRWCYGSESAAGCAAIIRRARKLHVYLRWRCVGFQDVKTGDK